ncbi:MAG: DUF167 domain-containing protein [Hyphomicrobiales bacterium]|nr:DUF167 domain-containing protein [Hyphomicrobiales bacterium]
MTVRLTPNARADAILGVDRAGTPAALRAKVRAVPEKGKANAALIGLMAGWLGVPRTSVTCVAGGKSRVKTLEIEGESNDLITRINERLDAMAR